MISKSCKISPSALIEPGVHIGDNCNIEAFTIIRSGVTLGDGVTVGSHCDLGIDSGLASSKTLYIGSGSTIRSHSRFYLGSNCGDSMVTGHGVTVRENSRIGCSVQIGTLSDIQGDCRIGDYSKLHSNVHVGKGSIIGMYAWLYPYVVLTNDPNPPSELLVGVEISHFAVIATMATILPGIKVGFGSFLGSHSLLNKDLPDELFAVGTPARILKNIRDIKTFDGGDSHYPWAFHFNRGYPPNLGVLYNELKSDPARIKSE